MGDVTPKSEWFKGKKEAELYAELAQGGRFKPYSEFAEQNLGLVKTSRDHLLMLLQVRELYLKNLLDPVLLVVPMVNFF